MRLKKEKFVSGPMVSVIVTVYQDEAYIDKCIKSLLCQDYLNYELIVVDDGASDLSGRIIDSFAEKDSRVIPIHQENNGVSFARNVGIEKARGEYLMFVDGDDWVDTDFVSYAVDVIKNNRCECGVICLADKNSFTNKSSVISSEKAIVSLYSFEIYPSVCNKIFSKETIINHNVRFNEAVCYGEDMLFTLEVFSKIDVVALGNKKKYHITPNYKSVTRGKKIDNKINNFKSLSLQGEIISRTDNYFILNRWMCCVCHYNRFIINEVVRCGLSQKRKRLYRKTIKNLRKYIIIPLRYERDLKRIIGWILYFLFPRLMAIRYSAIRKKSDEIKYI